MAPTCTMMMRVLLTVYVISWVMLISNSTTLEESFPEMMFTDWMEKNYRNVRPKQNHSQTLPVECSVLVYQLLMVDVKAGVFSISADLGFYWPDEILAMANVTTMTSALYPADKLWLPDVIVKNSVDAVVKKSWKETFPAWIDFSTAIPHVSWGFQDTFDLQCDFDIRWFPFDKHDCKLIISTYMTTNNTVLLVLDSCIDMGKFKTNSEFDVKEAGCNILESSYGDSLYLEIEFHLRLERQPLFYVANIVLPCLVLSLLSWFALLLPNDSGEKVSLEVTIMLTFSVFLLIVSDSVPKTATVPILGIYLLTLMQISMASMVTTITVLWMHHHDTSQPMPRLAHSIIFNVVTLCICRKSFSEDHKESVKNTEVHLDRTSAQNRNSVRDFDAAVTDFGSSASKPVDDSAEVKDYSEEWSEGRRILERSSVTVIITFLIVTNIVCLIVAPLLS